MAAEVLTSSHGWLKREADAMRNPKFPLVADGDGWISLYVEADQLEVCLHNMERIALFLSELGKGEDA